MKIQHNHLRESNNSNANSYSYTNLWRISLCVCHCIFNTFCTVIKGFLFTQSVLASGQIFLYDLVLMRTGTFPWASSTSLSFQRQKYLLSFCYKVQTPIQATHQVSLPVLRMHPAADLFVEMSWQPVPQEVCQHGLVFPASLDESAGRNPLESKNCSLLEFLQERQIGF